MNAVAAPRRSKSAQVHLLRNQIACIAVGVEGLAARAQHAEDSGLSGRATWLRSGLHARCVEALRLSYVLVRVRHA